jgi:hypothetical protein
MVVHVFDPTGRTHSTAARRRCPGRILFDGSGSGTVYVSDANGKVYRGKMKVSGLPPGTPRIKLPAWSDG